jgi:hypothetical protein
MANSVVIGLKHSEQNGKFSPRFGIRTFRIIGLGINCLIALLPLLAYGAGPSTPEDWQRMYEACLQGAAVAADRQGMRQDFPSRFCGCVRDNLRSTAEPQRDAAFPAIRDRCIQQATQ